MTATGGGIVGWALRNPHGVLVIVLAVLVLGVVTLGLGSAVGLESEGRMPTDILPQFNQAAVLIITFYPGMPAEIMEKDITSRIQRWTGQSVGIEHQEAKSMLGVSIVKDFFHEGVSPDTAISQVTAFAMSDLFYLPPGTVPPMTMPFDPTATFPLCLLAVSSDVDSDGKLIHDETALYDVAYFGLRNKVQGIEGVVAPAVYGGKLRRIYDYIDPYRLAALGLSPMDAVDKIRLNNTFIPVGAARIGAIDVLLDSNALPPRVEDMNDFPLKVEDGRVVTIKEAGEVIDSAELQSNIVRIDGARQAYIPIYRQPGKNTIAIVEGVKKLLEPIKKRIAKGINLEVIFDQSVFVRKAIDNLLLEMALGGLLAALMILIFLRSLRTTVFILIQLPLSIIAALVALYFTGHTINMMTLGGMALVTGMILDEGIVSVENIMRHLEMGKTPHEAALDGMQEMARPRLLIMITVVVVFFPVIFLEGVGKFLFLPMAVSVAFAMLFSYLFTMTFLPMLASRFLRPIEKENAIARGLKGMLERLQNTYRKLLGVALKAGWLVLLLVGGLFAFTALALYPMLGQELFPPIDSGQFMIRVREEPGTIPAITEKTCADVEHTIKTTIGDAALNKMITNIGVLNDWPAAYTPNSGPGDAFISIQLKDTDRKSVFEIVSELRPKLRRQFPGIDFSFDTSGILSAAVNKGVAAPINVQVDGKSFDVLRELTSKIRQRIADRVQGAQDVRIQQQLDTPAYKINIDPHKAALVGLNARDVVQNVVTAFRSSISFAKSFWLDPGNGNHYFVGAQYPAEYQDAYAIGEVLLNPGEGRRPIQLKNIATIEHETMPAEVTHLNITRIMDVYANVEGRDLGSVAADVDDILQEMRDNGEVPSGYAIHNRGEVKIMRKSFDGLAQGLGLAAVLVYLVMVVLFKSFLDPFIVMFAVPLGLIGVVMLLLFTGMTLNIQSIMGIIMMVGIVVAFSILLVEFANQLRARGHSVVEAVTESAVARLRPILMTALAAILGLTPMALHGGANIPLARAVIGGVAAAAILTLFVVPILYVLIKGRRDAPAKEA